MYVYTIYEYNLTTLFQITLIVICGQYHCREDGYFMDNTYILYILFVNLLREIKKYYINNELGSIPIGAWNKQY